jgi:hypothetical protein
MRPNTHPLWMRPYGRRRKFRPRGLRFQGSASMRCGLWREFKRRRTVSLKGERPRRLCDEEAVSILLLQFFCASAIFFLKLSGLMSVHTSLI